MTRTVIIGFARATLLAAALFLAGCYLPVIGTFLMIFAPLPVMDFAIRRPAWAIRASGVVAIATVLIAFTAGLAAGLGYLATFGLASLLICYLLEREARFELIVLATSAVMLVAGGLVALAAVGSPSILVNTLAKALSTGMAHGEEFYRRLGVESAFSAATRADVLAITLRISPAVIALSAAFAVFLNLIVFWRWLNRDRLGYRLFGDLARWSTPEWLIWVLLANGFALFAPIQAVRVVALDGFIIVAAIYFCQGLAIMAFYFKMLSMPSLARGLIYLVTGIQPVLTALVCAAGIFDMWVDFRRLKPPNQEAGNFGDFL
jgi:uncharacterized protein YybS (DUF2232 family)